jgi:hypothetical protein
MSPRAGPYYLAYVDQGTAFNPAVHDVMDEYVFRVDFKITEGDKPTLVLDILNPHIGLLNTSRKQWVWFSRMGSNGHIYPLFYGRIMAIPTNLVGEIITVNYIAWPIDFYQQRQALAEAVKVNGPYDAVFIDPAKADDPDTILEAISGSYCVDPITHVVTIEDFIEASDGNVNFTADTHFYDGFTIEVDQQAPLTSVLMDAQVGWDQTARGFLDMQPISPIVTYSGDGVINDWPKSSDQLGSGWSVFTGLASDQNHVESAVVGQIHTHWQNPAREHSDGDQLTLDINYSAFIGTGANAVIWWQEQPGLLDPFSVDGNGDPSPTNIPPHAESTTMYVPLWSVVTALTLRYDAVRPRTERILMLLKADMQATMVDPLVTQYTETIKKTGRNVGYPIVNLLDWTTVAGKYVAIGTVVFPDLPTLPGGQSIQIAIVAGHTGTVEPVFSDIPGGTTVDNQVTWSSLGQNQPSDGNYPDWTALTPVALGTIIVPRYPAYISDTALVAPGLAMFPKTGVEVSEGQIITVGGLTTNAWVCTLGGLTGIGNAFTGSAQWAYIGTIPDGKTMFLATAVSGPTGPLYIIPSFGLHTALHSTLTDGGVTWTNIGQGDIPAGGTIGNVWARSYFDSARGNKSIEYLISIMRAKMRLRGRAVRIGFDCAVDAAIGLNCRQTVTIEDTRIPGGIAVGKVVSVNYKANGETGEEICHVEIGCAIGHANAVTQQPGNYTYVNGYVNGYRVYTDQVITLPDLSDVGYTPPTAPGVDDGLVFTSLHKTDVVISEAVYGTLAKQTIGLNSAFASATQAAILAQTVPGSLAASVNIQNQIAQAQSNSVGLQLELNPIWYSLTLKPLNRPFSNVYRVNLTELTMEKGVDLAGASTP